MADQEAPAPTAELLLYAADLGPQHVETLIRPALERGDWVISDRFSGSTLAYQGYGRGLDQDLIQRLEGIATTGLQPDLTLWLPFPFKRACSAVSGTRRTASKPREPHSWSGLHRVLPSWPSSAPGAPSLQISQPAPFVLLWNVSFRSIWLERAVWGSDRPAPRR